MVELNKTELGKIGVQFGNLVRLRNPRMRPYIHAQKRGKYILDLGKIIRSCQEIRQYVESLVTNNKKILFLATKKQAQEIVKEQAIKCGMPYIVNKWKGGFLTNFGEIKKKLKELQGLNTFIQKDNFKKLIKKKQVSLEKRRNKLQSIYEGVMNLWYRPDAIFVIGLTKEKTAFREAKKARVPIIAVCNTNCNPYLVDFVIPGNDENAKSINFFASLMADTINECKKGSEREEQRGNYNTHR